MVCAISFVVRVSGFVWLELHVVTGGFRVDSGCGACLVRARFGTGCVGGLGGSESGSTLRGVAMESVSCWDQACVFVGFGQAVWPYIRIVSLWLVRLAGDG